jgi:hypothetical protein
VTSATTTASGRLPFTASVSRIVVADDDGAAADAERVAD